MDMQRLEMLLHSPGFQVIPLYHSSVSFLCVIPLSFLWHSSVSFLCAIPLCHSSAPSKFLRLHTDWGVCLECDATGMSS